MPKPATEVTTDVTTEVPDAERQHMVGILRTIADGIEAGRVNAIALVTVEAGGDGAISWLVGSGGENELMGAVHRLLHELVSSGE